MKHDMHIRPDPIAAVSSIQALRPACDGRLDPTPVAALYQSMTCHEVEALICRALEEIAFRLNALQTMRRAGDFALMSDPATRLAKIACPLGLLEVATAAQHVAQSARQADPVAVEATLDRLERGFDISIVQIWDADIGA